MSKQKFLITIVLSLLFVPVFFASAGTILASYKYAWSNNVGYINFEKVVVNDNALSGYAWSENTGWINFAPAIGGGVLNDGDGNLSGSAWGEGLGWINFSGVTISTTTGKFSGQATGDVIGTLTFDCLKCDVRTDWTKNTPPTPTPPAPTSGRSSGGRVMYQITYPLVVPSSPSVVPVINKEVENVVEAKNEKPIILQAGAGFGVGENIPPSLSGSSTKQTQQNISINEITNTVIKSVKDNLNSGVKSITSLAVNNRNFILLVLTGFFLFYFILRLFILK